MMPTKQARARKQVMGTAAKPAAATPAAQWRRPTAGELVELPSGNVARLKRVRLEDVVRSGSLPDPLAALIDEVIQATLQGRDVNAEAWQAEWQQRTDTQLSYEQMVRMINKIVPLVFLEPRVVTDHAPDYDAGEIALEDVGFDDQQAAFVWAMGEVGLLAEFFPKPA